MGNIIRQFMEDKQTYKAQMQRGKALPEDYQYVFQKIHDYIWTFAKGDGSKMLEHQEEIVILLEEGVRQGKAVLEITGEDVAGFCQELIRDGAIGDKR